MAVLGLVLALATAHAVTITDKRGDFDRTDVTALRVDVRNAAAVFTVTYAEEEIGSFSSAGGIIGLDTDRNQQTGAAGSRGFEFQITYNAGQLAPSAELLCWSGFEEDNTLKIGPQYGNGTDFSFTARTVTITVPLKMLESDGNFDFALYATGMFSVGSEWDRVPDTGVVNSRSGKVKSAGIAGAGGPRTYTARPGANGKPLIKSVKTSVQGGNVIWEIESARALPVDPLAFQSSTTINVLIDVDRSLATGIQSGGVPFLPFGPDRKVVCTLVAGGNGSAEIVTGIEQTGERTYAGGGAGSNDLQITFDRRKAKLVLPLWLVGAQSASFDWMLSVTRTTSDAPVHTLLGSSIRFDDGQVCRPLPLPPHAFAMPDPIDAAMVVQDPAGKAPRRISVTHLPNIELVGLDSALTKRFLFARIRYHKPLSPQPHYLTAVDMMLRGADGTRRRFRTSVNWHPVLGGQAVMRDLTTEGDLARSHWLNQCVAVQGKTACVLLPAEAFGLQAFSQVDLAVVTGQRSANVAALTKVDQQGRSVPDTVFLGWSTDTLDRIPNAGWVSLTAR